MLSQVALYDPDGRIVAATTVQADAILRRTSRPSLPQTFPLPRSDTLRVDECKRVFDRAVVASIAR